MMEWLLYKEVHEFDIVEIIGEAVEDPVEAEKVKQDIEYVVFEEFTPDLENKSESHYVDTHVDNEINEIKGEGEIEIVVTTLAKYEKNPAIEVFEKLSLIQRMKKLLCTLRCFSIFPFVQ